MPFVVTGKCVKCRYTDCVDVCPVDAFYEGENMLVINPEECIECGVCEAECPVEAIKSDEELDASEEKWAAFNARYAEQWPNLTKSKGAMPEADEWADKSSEEKEDFASVKPGTGDE